MVNAGLGERKCLLGEWLGGGVLASGAWAAQTYVDNQTPYLRWSRKLVSSSCEPTAKQEGSQGSLLCDVQAHARASSDMLHDGSGTVSALRAIFDEEKNTETKTKKKETWGFGQYGRGQGGQRWGYYLEAWEVAGSNLLGADFIHTVRLLLGSVHTGTILDGTNGRKTKQYSQCCRNALALMGKTGL